MTVCLQDSTWLIFEMVQPLHVEESVLWIKQFKRSVNAYSIHDSSLREQIHNTQCENCVQLNSNVQLTRLSRLRVKTLVCKYFRFYTESKTTGGSLHAKLQRSLMITI